MMGFQKKSYICRFEIVIMRFKDIAGQIDVANHLTEIIDSGRVSHAQLFLGQAEDGALAMAWAYVQYLCCTHRQHYPEGALRADSCGECPECKRIQSLMHPDLHFIFPTATTTRVKDKPSSDDFGEEFMEFMKERGGRGSIEEWLQKLDIENKQAIINVRDASLVEQNLALKSYGGGWKMVLIWMPERMNTECANKLLKTLEEPTGQTLLLMVGESEERLLPTIRSRVQTVRLNRVERTSTEEAGMFAALLVEWLRLLFKLRMRELSGVVEKLAALGREKQRQFLAYTLGVMRSCFLHSAAGMDCHIGSGDEKFDAMFPNMVTTNNIEMIDSALNEALYAISRNANPKIAFMQLSFSMSKALKKR